MPRFSYSRRMNEFLVSNSLSLSFHVVCKLNSVFGLMSSVWMRWCMTTLTKRFWKYNPVNSLLLRQNRHFQSNKDDFVLLSDSLLDLFLTQRNKRGNKNPFEQKQLSHVMVKGWEYLLDLFQDLPFKQLAHPNTLTWHLTVNLTANTNSSGTQLRLNNGN